MKKTIAIVGLGLIGGSMAMALHGFESFELLGADVSQPTLRYALEHHMIDRATDDPVFALSQADVIFLCMHPQGIIQFLEQNRDRFRAGAMITDVCGIKKTIVTAAQGLPNTVSFLGGHPMAGTEYSGVQNAIPNMFHGAHYILTPNAQTSAEHLALMKRIAMYIGCANVVETTPEQHDAMIAYTSQMMHIIAVAVCDDPSLFEYLGFEGDSFRSCTRVAALDVSLWTQLFTANSSALCAALERLEHNIHAYREVIASGDRENLMKKLFFSSERKRDMNRMEQESGAMGRDRDT